MLVLLLIFRQVNLLYGSHPLPLPFLDYSEISKPTGQWSLPVT